MLPFCTSHSGILHSSEQIQENHTVMQILASAILLFQEKLQNGLRRRIPFGSMFMPSFSLQLRALSTNFPRVFVFHLLAGDVV